MAMNFKMLENNLNDTDILNISEDITMLANSANFLENVSFHLYRTETGGIAEDPFIKMEEDSELMNGGETVTAEIIPSIVNSTQKGKGFLAAGEASQTAESKNRLLSETGADAGASEIKNDKKKCRKNNAGKDELKNDESSALEMPPKKVRSAKKKRMDSKERDIEILPEIKRTNSVEKNEITQYLALTPNKHDDKVDESLEEADGVLKDMPKDSSTGKYCKKKLKKKKRIVLDDQAKEDQVKDTTTNSRKTEDTNELKHCNVNTEGNKLIKRSEVDEIFPFDSNESDEPLVQKQNKCENMEINSPEQKISGTRKRKITIKSEDESSVLNYETSQCTSGEKNELRGNIFGTSTKSFRVKKNPATRRKPRTLSASFKNTTTKSDVRALNTAAKDEDVLDEKFAEAINSSTCASSENEHAAKMTPKTKKQKKEKPEDAVISVLSPKKKVKEIDAERKKIKLKGISHKETADANELSLPKDSSQKESSNLNALEVNDSIKKKQKIHKTSTQTENKLIVKICGETSDEHAMEPEQPLRKRLKKKKLDDSTEEEHHDSIEFPVLQTIARAGKSKSLQKAINKQEISNESTTLNVNHQNDPSNTNDDNEIKSSYVMHKSSKPRPRNFICSYCNKRFTCRYNLKIHHSTHTGDALPYPCSHSGCSKSFATPAATRNHEVSAHLDERSYMCKFCGKSFALIYGLRTHSRWCDSRNTLFTCSNCGKQFRMEWKYAAHVANKKCKDAEHECEFRLCNKRFVDTYRLRRHMMRIHNVPMHIKKT